MCLLLGARSSSQEKKEKCTQVYVRVFVVVSLLLSHHCTAVFCIRSIFFLGRHTLRSVNAVSLLMWAHDRPGGRLAQDNKYFHVDLEVYYYILRIMPSIYFS